MSSKLQQSIWTPGSDWQQEVLKNIDRIPSKHAALKSKPNKSYCCKIIHNSLH